MQPQACNTQNIAYTSSSNTLKYLQSNLSNIHLLSVQFLNSPTHVLPLQTRCQASDVKLHDTVAFSPIRLTHASGGGVGSGQPIAGRDITITISKKRNTETGNVQLRRST